MTSAWFLTAPDLTAFVRALSILDNVPEDSICGLDYATAIEAACNEWEQRSGYVPFVSVPGTRTFDPPGPKQDAPNTYYGFSGLWLRRCGGYDRLYLRCGLTSLTSVKIGKFGTDPGTLLTEGEDFWLRPENADAFGKPFTYIQFDTIQWGPPSSIEVIGSWGYTDTLPGDVKLAILQYAAYLMAPQLALAISGGLYSVQRDNFETRFAGSKQSPLSGESEMWRNNFERRLQRYKLKNIV